MNDELFTHAIGQGGTAFPCQFNGPDSTVFSFTGMTLRDYFAAKALIGLLDSEARQADAKWVAVTAYVFADAMLDARNTPSAGLGTQAHAKGDS